MFTHILLPTDGSNLSQAAIQKGVQLAKSTKAKISGISVVPEQKYYLYQTGINVQEKDERAKHHKLQANRNLAVLERRPKTLVSPARRTAKSVITPMRRSLESLKKEDAI